MLSFWKRLFGSTATPPAARVDPRVEHGPDAITALRAAVERRLEATYGPGGMGWANPIEVGLVEYVHVFVVAGPPRHYAYVTRGLHRWRHPHELVVRVAIDDGAAAPGFESAPQWPVTLIHLLAGMTERTGNSPCYNDYVRHINASGVDLTFRHVAFVRDAVLAPIDDGAGFLAFVQVVPLGDAQLAAMDAIPAGATNTVLRDWAARDPLLVRRPASGGPAAS